MELDFIRDPRYGVMELSEAIINYPNQFGLMAQLGIFGESSISQTTVTIDIANRGQINVIDNSPRGAPVDYDTTDTQDMRALPTFRYARGASLLADEFQNVRAFGTTNEFSVFDVKLAEKMQVLNQAHAQTTEWLRWQSLLGNVVNSKGQVLYNAYTLMGETQNVINYALSSTTDIDPIQTATNAAMDYIQLNSFGEPVTGLFALCSPGFFDQMTKNEEFRKAYTYFAGVPNPLRDNLRDGFFHKGITYLRHIGQVMMMNADGTRTLSKFIPDNTAILLPLGTHQVFRTYYAPADYIETVNTPGQRLYAKTDIMKGNRGIEVETISQQLNMVLKPRLVQKLTFS